MRRVLAGVLVVALAAGCQVDQKYSQTELSALQTREFAAGLDATYDATINAMFDAGYTIRASDKRGGFISGGRMHGDAWSGYQHGLVQVKIESAGTTRTSVRVSTSDGAQQRVDKEQIDELLTLIERRLLSGAALPVAGRGQ